MDTENLDIFQNAIEYFKIWAAERQNILEELKRIKDEIQRQVRIHTIGSITYSSVGFVGAALTIAGIVKAPFTVGVSLALTVAAIATGLTSGVAGVTHGVVKLGIVKKQCKIAERSLKKHNETCEEMKNIIINLTKEIDMNDCHSFETSHFYEYIGLLIQIGYIGFDEIPELVQKCQAVSHGVTKLSVVLAAAGILFDIGCIIYNAVNLAKFEKGKLCTEAAKLQTVIEQMEKEYETLKDFFEESHTERR